MDDSISRQAAIDIADELRSYINVVGYWAWVERLKGLPTAQPEIIRCKDCKYFEYDHPYIIQGIPVLGHEVCNAWGDGCKTDENGYCFMAERRADDE